MTRQSRKPQAHTEGIRAPGGEHRPDAAADRSPEDTQDRIRTDEALTAARLAGLDARVVVRPTIVLGQPLPSRFKLDGSTLRGVLLPGRPQPPAPAAPPHGGPEAFGLVTLPPSLVDELVTGPLPEPDEPPAATNYLGDDCQTVRLGPEAVARLELPPAGAAAWNGTLSLARTSVRTEPVSEDAVTWALPSVEEALLRPLPPPPPSAAPHPGPPAARTLGRTWRPPGLPVPEAPQPRARFLPIWAWSLAGLALLTMLIAYVLTSSLLSHEPSPRLEPASGASTQAVNAQHGPASAAISGSPGTKQQR